MGKEGRPKLKGKKTKWGRREKEGGKGIKNKREREKKAKKGREEMTRLKNREIRRKGRGK